MARKNTYASVMDSMSKKLASYQDRLAKAERQGDSIGMQDYTRRIQKVQKGMETLFNTQEASKQPQANMGEGLQQFGPGGLTSTTYAEYKDLISMLPQNRSEEDNARLQQLEQEVQSATARGWSEDFGFNPDGSLASRPMDAAESVTDAPPAPPYTGPSITPQGALDKVRLSNSPQFNQGPAGEFGLNEITSLRNIPPTGTTASQPAQTQQTVANTQDNGPMYAPGEEQYDGMTQYEIERQMRADMTGLELGRPEQFYNPYNQRMYDVTDEMYADMVNGGFGQNMNLGNYDPVRPQSTPESIPTAEELGLGMPAITGTAPISPDVQTFTGPYNAVPTELVPGTENIATTSVPSGSSGLGDINIGGAPEVINAPVSNNLKLTEDVNTVTNAGDTANTDGNTGTGNLKNFFNQIAGEPNKLAQFGQFIPDALAFAQMSRAKGPVDMPSQTTARMNTDLNFNPQIAQAQEKLAASEAAIDQNVSNPIVAAALKRSARNEVAQQEGALRGQELNTEMQLQNQYAQNIANTANQNLMIDAQNRQRNVDFKNERQAAQARMLQQVGQKGSQIYAENQNRQADLKRLGLSSLMYDQGMQERLMNNFGNLEDFITGGRR